MDKKMKLSPNSNYKKSSSKNQVKQGFDRNEFRNRVEKIFDKRFEHNRKVEETFEYLNAKKHNRIKEMEKIKEEYKNVYTISVQPEPKQEKKRSLKR